MTKKLCFSSREFQVAFSKNSNNLIIIPAKKNYAASRVNSKQWGKRIKTTTIKLIQQKRIK